MVQTQSDSFDLKFLIEEDELLILLVALEHDYIIDISSELYVSLVKLEARVQVAALGDRVYLLGSVAGLIVALALFDPVQEHGVVELGDGGRH